MDLSPKLRQTVSRNSTRNVRGWNELEVECGGLFGEPLHLLLAIPGFISFHPPVDVVGTEFQHAVSESGQLMRMAVTALGAPSLDRRRRKLAPSAL
jgi:hypothetical protein